MTLRATTIAVSLLVSGCSSNGGVGDVDGGESDSGARDGGLSVPTQRECGGAAAYRATFETNTREPGWFNIGSPDRFERTGSELVIRPFALSAGLVTDARVNLLEDVATLEVTKHFESGDTSASASFAALDGRANFGGFHITHSELRMEIKSSGAVVLDETIPLERLTHRFLRLAETNSELHFDVSADGESWVRLRSAPTPPFWGRAYIELLVMGAGATVIHVDNINAGAGPRRLCGSSTVVDDFEGAKLSNQWDSHADAKCKDFGQAAGVFVMDQFAEDGFSNCLLGTTHQTDLTGDSMTVQLAGEPTSDPNFFAFTSLGNSNGLSIDFLWSNGELCGRLSGGTSLGCFITDPEIRTWRVRELGGTLEF